MAQFAVLDGLLGGFSLYCGLAIGAEKSLFDMEFSL